MAISSIINFAAWLTFSTVWALAFSQSRHRALNRSFMILAGCCSLFSFLVFATHLPAGANYLDHLTVFAVILEIALGVLVAQFAYRLVNRETDVFLWAAYGLTIAAVLVIAIDPRASSSVIHAGHVHTETATKGEVIYFAALFMSAIACGSLSIVVGLVHWFQRRPASRQQSPIWFVIYGMIAVPVLVVTEVILPLIYGKHLPYDIGMVVVAGLLVTAFVELRRRSLFAVDSERMLGHLLRDVDQGVAIADGEGCIRQMNPWMKDLLGIDPADDRPRELADLLPWALDAGDDDDVEFQLQRQRAVHTYRLSKAAYYNRGGKRRGRKMGEVCFVRDITEARRTEELSRMSREELEHEVGRRSEEFFQKQKMAAVGALAPGIVHDFNNMLATIIGLGSAAKSDLTHGHPIGEDVDEILQAAFRARDLVRQIPTERSAQTVERTVVKLGRIVEDVIGQVTVSLGSHIEIKHSASDESSFVMGNPTQFHQLVLNLANNAIQAMKHTGGELRIQLDTLELDGAAVIAQTNLQPELYVRLRVSDTGRGMDAETLDRVFEPFFTTKETGEGTGLGLAMARKVAIDHDGAIVAESRPGEGSSFTLYLPSIVQEAWQTTAPEDVVEGGDEHLLIVDDDESVAHAMKRLLETLGYRATVIHDAFEAVLRFKNAPDDFDLVLTDYSMPGMNGLNLATAIFTERPGMPVILVTGVSDNQDLLNEADAVGVREVILKPPTREMLAGAVRRGVDR